MTMTGLPVNAISHTLRLGKGILILNLILIAIVVLAFKWKIEFIT